MGNEVKLLVPPRLCGGVFLTLLFPKCKDNDGGRSMLVEELVKIATGKIHNKGVLASDITKYLQFTLGKTGMLMNNRDDMRALCDARIEGDYKNVLKEMHRFLKNHLLEYDEDSFSKTYLPFVQDFLFIIEHDEKIDKDHDFYIRQSGDPVKKKDLAHETEICLDSFILGIWHYIYCNVVDNKEGLDMYKTYFQTSSNSWKTGGFGKSYSFVYAVQMVEYIDEKKEAEDIFYRIMEPLGPRPSVIDASHIMEKLEGASEEKKKFIYAEACYFIEYLRVAIEFLADCRYMQYLPRSVQSGLIERIREEFPKKLFLLKDELYKSQCISINRLFGQILQYYDWRDYSIKTVLDYVHSAVTPEKFDTDHYVGLMRETERYRKTLFKTYENFLDVLTTSDTSEGYYKGPTSREEIYEFLYEALGLPQIVKMGEAFEDKKKQLQENAREILGESELASSALDELTTEMNRMYQSKIKDFLPYKDPD